MLRHLAITFCAIITLLFAFESSFATDAPCVPDCQQSAYNGPYTRVLQLSPTCFVQVTYWRRLACGVNEDVAITQVRILSTPGCNLYNTGVFLETVTRAYLVQTTGTLRQDSCVTQWHVTRASCWRSDSVNLCGDTLMVPCRGEGCCLISYRICGDSNRPGGKSVTPVTILTTGTCADTRSGWSPCRNACDTSISGSFWLKTTSVGDVEDAGDLSAYPNPSDMTVTVSSGSAEFAKIVSLLVVDVSGRPVISLRPSPDNVLGGSITFDVSNLPSGTYLVTCTTESGRMTTRFSVNH